MIWHENKPMIDYKNIIKKRYYYSALQIYGNRHTKNQLPQKRVSPKSRLQSLV